MSEPAFPEITQHELRNGSGAILRAVEAGKTFIVPRNGTPIAELHPLRQRTFIPTTQLLAILGREQPINADQFFADLDDDVVDQRPPMSDRHPRGLLDTNVIVYLPLIEPDELPVESAISSTRRS